MEDYTDLGKIRFMHVAQKLINNIAGALAVTQCRGGHPSGFLRQDTIFPLEVLTMVKFGWRGW